MASGSGLFSSPPSFCWTLKCTTVLDVPCQTYHLPHVVMINQDGEIKKNKKTKMNMPGRCSTDAVCKRKHVVQLRTIKRPNVYVQKLLFFASNEAGLKPQPYISSVFLRAATFLKIAFKFKISRFFFLSKLPANQRSLFIYFFSFFFWRKDRPHQWLLSLNE